MKPMNTSKTILFFSIPGIIIYALFTFAYKYLINLGIPIYWATYICLWVPLIFQLVIIVILFKISKVKLNEYFYINRLSIKQIGIVLIGLIIVQLSEQLLDFTRPIMSHIAGFSVPVYYPDLFQANLKLEVPLNFLLGMQIKNNSFAILFFALWLITNIVCEETLWRGYALPRMEKYFGKWAWLINGMLWNFAVHFFFRWSFIAILPISFIVPYLSQKYKSLWPGVIIHGIGNSLLLILVFYSV